MKHFTFTSNHITMKNFCTYPRFLPFLTLIFLLLASISIFANEYRLNAASTGWSNRDFSESTGGYYEYYESDITPSFWFNLNSKTNGNISSQVIPPAAGFNGTDIMTIGQPSNQMYYVEPAPAHYYIIVWLPNTPYNSSANPVICASTTLPDDTATPSCSAPTSVNVTPTETDGWGRFVGEIISLTAAPVGGTGTPSYQWKLNGANIAGATSATYTKENCTIADAGNYTCEITMGTGCSTTSDNYLVKVYTLQQYTGGTTSYNFVRVGNSKIGRVEVPLTSSGTAYEFKVFCGASEYYGNNGTINADATDWVWEGAKNNVKLNTSWTGTFVFTLDYTQNGGAPKVSVQYPRKTIYMVCGGTWCDASPKFYAHTWGHSDFDTEVVAYACASGVYTADIPVYNNNLIFTRQNASSTGIDFTPEGSGGHFWNQSQDITIGANDCFTFTSWSGGKGNFSASTYTIPTFTISFNGNGSDGGTMSPLNVTCADDVTLTVNAFTRTAYIFTGWNTAADGSGTFYANGSTVSNVTADITLYAQWTPGYIVDIPGTVDKANHDSHSADMTWYGVSDEYFDFGPTNASNLGRWAEWKVNLIASDLYSVKVVVDFPSSPDGYQWQLELIDGSDVTVATYTSVQKWGYNEYTYDAQWDLTGITPGRYTLRVKNIFSWAQPKLKSITFTGTFIPGTVTISAIKVTDAPSYVGGAYGAITDTDISTHPAIPEGTTVTDNGDNTITINTAEPITITAPLTTAGLLYSIPEYAQPSLSCTWRFDHWENVPTTGITSSVYIRAVYIPTFNVEYETNGGTINEDPYPTWYRYTGDPNDYQLLPIDVTKPGFSFAGWYQNATTELFTRLEGNYYGDYAGVWCLKAHWVLPCDEAQIISKVVLTGQNTYTVSGYNNDEYAGTPVVSIGSTTATYDFGTGIGTQTGYELSSTNDILFATLKKGDFRVGDTIIVAITAVNTIREASSTTNILALYYGNSASDAHLLVNMRNVSSPGIYKYPLSSDNVLEMNEANATGVGVFRESVNGENPCVYSIEIHGCRDLIFDDHNGTGVWNDPLNWAPTYTEIPSYYQATRIIRPCIVNIADAHALNAKLCKGNGNNGSLTINADAALEVTQEVSEVRGTDYVTLYPVAPEDLVIKSNASNQGALAHGDTEGNTHATIEFYARGAGYKIVENPTWQYMGVPFSDVAHAIDHYYGSEMCRWYENETGNAGENWKWVNKPEALVPFVGYALTNPSAKVFTNQGTLVPSVNQTISLTCDGTNYKGWNLFANSWMAPINIARFEAADFGAGVQQTIYLFNTGTNDGHQSSFPDQNTETGSAGQYVAVPIATATVLGANKFIAPMQGFYLVTEAAATVTLNYDRLVRNSEHTALSVLPNRAPRYNSTQEEAEAMPRLVIDVLGTQFSDRLYIFENPNRTNDFDNAWDGYKFEGEDYAPQLMTRTNDINLAVDVSPAFGGKQIAFRAGEDADYTLRFSTSVEGLVLRDLLLGTETPIEDGGTYHFFGTNKEPNIRFEIVDNRYEIPTSIEETMEGNGQILSLRVYTADGRLVLHRTNGFDKPLLLPQSGVYILQMQTTTGLKTQKITF